MSDHVDRVPPDDLPPYLVDEDRMKELLGIVAPDDLTEADLNAMATATALIQGYTDRMLVAATYTERHYGVRIGSLQLHEYPVSQVQSLQSITGSDDAENATDLTGWRLVRPTGILLNVRSCVVEAVYDGGYDPMPADIEAAFVETFRSVKASLALATAGGDEALAPLVKKASVVGVGSIEYGSTEQAGSVVGVGLLPANAVGLLERYRHAVRVG